MCRLDAVRVVVLGRDGRESSGGMTQQEGHGHGQLGVVMVDVRGEFLPEVWVRDDGEGEKEGEKEVVVGLEVERNGRKRGGEEGRGRGRGGRKGKGKR